jgi:hypothetical protein
MPEVSSDKILIPKIEKTLSIIKTTENPKINNFIFHFEHAKKHLLNLVSFNSGVIPLLKERLVSQPKKIEVKVVEPEVLTNTDNVESAPDYDESLVEVSEHISNQYPLISKYINTIFSKNIMRSLKEDDQRAVAFKGEALLANGPKGIVISKNNLKFLEASFSRFKTRFGLSKLIISTPAGYNPDYARKLTKFLKNYFSYELEFISNYPGAEGFEIILVGAHL